MVQEDLHLAAKRRAGSDLSRTTALLCLLWLLFIVRGVFYCVALPLWEGFDEPYHFAAVQYVAATGHMPVRGTPVGREVLASLYLTPESWMLRLHSLPRPVVTYDDYWALSPEVRGAMSLELAALPDDWKADSSSAALENYEAQQTPLYYFIAASVPRFAGHSLPTQVLVVRLFNVFLASVTVPLGYLAFKRVFPDARAALLGVALVVSLPELMINVARVSNEALAMVIASAIVLLSLRLTDSVRPGAAMLGIGVLLGLGLLTKAYFLTYVPAVAFCFLLFLVAHRQERARLAGWAAASAVVMLAIAGRWYWQVHQATGSWSGDINDTAARALSTRSLVMQAVHVNWKSGAMSVLVSHVWFGGWSFLRLPARYYELAWLLGAFGILASVLVLARPGAPLRLRFQILTALVFYVCFWLGLGYEVLVTYVHVGVSASTGWYLYCLVVAEVLLIGAGPLYWLGPKYRNLSLTLPVAVFVLIDLYGMHKLMLPYYSGLIRHVGDIVRPLPASQMIHFPARRVFGNLATIAPARLSGVGLIAFWLAYVCATLAVLLLGIGLTVPLNVKNPQA